MEQDCLTCPKNSIQNGAAWLVVVVFSVFILKTLDFILIPFAIALLLIYILGIPLNFLERFRIPSWLRIVIVVSFCLGIIYLFGRMVHANIQSFITQMPVIEKKLLEYFSTALLRFEMNEQQVRETFNAFLGSMGENSIEPVGAFLKKVGGSFFQFLGNSIWVLLFLLFILAERAQWETRLQRALGAEQAGAAQETGNRINRAVEHYLGLKTLLSLATGVLATIVLWIFGVEFALLWGVLTFALNYIPNIGSMLATLPPVCIALFQFGSLGKALAVGAVLTMVQMVIGNFFEPKLMGRGLNLSPLVVLFALIFWGWLWGMVGMFLAVPLTAAIKIAMEQYGPTKTVADLMSAK